MYTSFFTVDVCSISVFVFNLTFPANKRVYYKDTTSSQDREMQEKKSLGHILGIPNISMAGFYHSPAIQNTACYISNMHCFMTIIQINLCCTWHPQLKTGGFCRSKILLPTCHCRQQIQLLD